MMLPPWRSGAWAASAQGWDSNSASALGGTERLRPQAPELQTPPGWPPSSFYFRNLIFLTRAVRTLPPYCSSLGDLKELANCAICALNTGGTCELGSRTRSTLCLLRSARRNRLVELEIKLDLASGHCPPTGARGRIPPPAPRRDSPFCPGPYVKGFLAP